MYFLIAATIPTFDSILMESYKAKAKSTGNDNLSSRMMPFAIMLKPSIELQQRQMGR